MEYLALISEYKSEFALVNELKDTFERGTLGEYDVYFPTYTAKIRIRRTKKIVDVVRPLYGRYVFFGLENKASWKYVSNARYLSNIICHSGSPVWIPDRQIVECRTYNKDEGIKRQEYATSLQLNKGDRAIILEGPFKFLECTYIGKNRIKAKLFGQDTIINIDSVMLRKIMV